MRVQPQHLLRLVDASARCSSDARSSTSTGVVASSSASRSFFGRFIVAYFSTSGMSSCSPRRRFFTSDAAIATAPLPDSAASNASRTARLCSSTTGVPSFRASLRMVAFFDLDSNALACFSASASRACSTTVAMRTARSHPSIASSTVDPSSFSLCCHGSEGRPVNSVNFSVCRCASQIASVARATRAGASFAAASTAAASALVSNRAAASDKSLDFPAIFFASFLFNCSAFFACIYTTKIQRKYPKE
mmetsp:Transcript_90/g.255  ORF Transcript_90/g.255 Transcript_90/m.255 type:complete len:248 (+) Transcript_90:94-837(+)